MKWVLTESTKIKINAKKIAKRFKKRGYYYRIKPHSVNGQKWYGIWTRK